MSEGSPRPRLFVAVRVPHLVHPAIVASLRPLQRLAPDARWTDAASWHLTVAFLGPTPLERVPAVERACARAAARGEPFALALDGRAGTFRSGVLWASLEASAPLERLAAAVRDALLLEGFDLEARPFRAHLTLARTRRGQRLPRGIAERYQGPAVAWDVDELELLRSRPEPGGARYTREAAWALGAGGGGALVARPSGGGA